jgi:hypothetical protein
MISCSTEPEKVVDDLVIDDDVLVDAVITEKAPPPPPLPIEDTADPLESLVNREGFTNTLLIELDYVMPRFSLSGNMIFQRDLSKERIRLENGTVIIQEEREGNQLIFEEYAEGKALRMEPNNEEIVLYVAFIKEDGTFDDNTLIFASDKFDPNGLFYLKTYNKSVDRFSANEEESIQYGDQEYLIQYEGEIPPHLLISVLRSDNIETENVTIFPSLR